MSGFGCQEVKILEPETFFTDERRTSNAQHRTSNVVVASLHVHHLDMNVEDTMKSHLALTPKRYPCFHLDNDTIKQYQNFMNTLNYKGYTAKVEFDPEDNILFGNIIGIRDTVGFHGESVSELKEAFQEAVDFYLESCEKAGRKPNKPFSGKFVVRVDSSLHGEIAAAAVHSGKSLNKWVADSLKKIIHTP